MTSKTMTPHICNMFGAVVADDLPTVMKLVETDHVDLNQTFRGATALAMAFYKNRESIFHWILNNADEIDLDMPSNDGKGRIEPLLVAACRVGNKEMMTILLNKGADIDAVDNYNHTALWMATRQRRIDIVELLISYGAKINISEMWNESPLYLSLKYPRREKMAAMLILNGACVNFPGESRTKTLLHWCMFHCHKDIIKLLAYTGYNITKEQGIWLSLPARVAEDVEFCRWLKDELSTPPNLQRQCRVAIRRQVLHQEAGRLFLQKLKTLPLPQRLLDYLAMNDIQTELALSSESSESE
ncbi:serine/threonine-protein phosphatase 6 regulatory ankyrin repeat subunit B [Lingula anatina]|uniref:Serine/threonine-protein phosphatase 6 regulatory ankyrin repeat subunit B n=1 Tax=Lingula anatina TaxID=7574 RepID=A0A1S3HH61_LINAN|nr:serine/threonine-protein phosphatase 6 regulatory ankyrin repeat subunit B [Lingula anatina]|eukprot:XP_013384369.1 serine/threonine-protein phosphatase 6 regulatory ankyrin repeat subunit B [Lingula anatina]